MSIQVLDSETINKIAAGEVIERPASIVKELAENAIDAGASAVTIEIRDGGIGLIRVTDNGCGIPKEEVRSAFLRHATSKIRSAEDLPGVMSLGFRGEALSSIAAVCRTEVITKTAASLTGVRCVIEGGEETAFEEVGAPEGTTMIARDIFFHTPVRRKFLKSPATEAAHVAELAEQLALSHPEISVRYIQNGQNKFSTSGNRAVKDIIYRLYGRETANCLIEVKAENDFFRLEGYIGKPEISRGSRSMEHYCINGRYIKSNLIAKAIEDGFGNRLMQHMFPTAVLLISADPFRIDVNVHPTKREVRFSDPQSVYDFIRMAVNEALDRTELIRNAALPAAGEARARTKSRSGSTSGTLPAAGSATAAGSPAVPAGTPDPMAKAAVRPGTAAGPQTVPEEISAKTAEAPAEKAERLPKRAAEPFEEKRAAMEKKTAEACGQAPAAASGVQECDRQIPQNISLSDFITAYGKTAGPEQGALRFETGRTADRVRETAPEYGALERHGQYSLFAEGHRDRVRLVGTVFDTYWIAEWNGAVYIIDQHAAHEKVNYERFSAAFRKQAVTSQQLMPPLIITLTDREALLVQENEELFRNLGYEIEAFGGHEYAVRAVPDILPSVMKDELLKNMIGSLSEDTAAGLPQLILEKTASMSCKAAVKGNQHLSAGEAEKLLDEMFRLENPYQCPHGRPTAIRLTQADLERRFKRIV